MVNVYMKQAYQVYSSRTMCAYSYGLDTTEASFWNASCNPFAYGQLVQITSTYHDRLTLCEVDVIGAKLNFYQPGDLIVHSPEKRC
jgi:hypothetical protein